MTAKEEKEVCFDANCKEHGVKLPTLTEQKGEWEELEIEFANYEPVKGCETLKELFDGGDVNEFERAIKWVLPFIAAKLAQKEQAVKAEIIGEIIEYFKINPIDIENQEGLISLISDK